jgi:hypothetical protein
MLWIEFAAPVQDPNDRYFARVLKYAPDTLLLGTPYATPSIERNDPPMSLDPEPVRRIVPEQSLDTAGIDAMQPLIPTSSPTALGPSATTRPYAQQPRDLRLLHVRASRGSLERQHRHALVHGAGSVRTPATSGGRAASGAAA